MNYFKKELWMQINSSDAAVREKANNIWQQNAMEHAKRFQKVKKYLSKAFLDVYENGGFHDAVIRRISFLANADEKCFVIELLDGDDNIAVIFKGVKSFASDFSGFDGCICGEVWWGYAEFSLEKSCTFGKPDIRFSLLCDMTNELTIVFRTVEIMSLRDYRESYVV